MRSREGLRGATVSVAISSLVSAGSLGAAAILIARTLGPEGRGVFAASYSLLYVLAIAGSLGVGPGGRRLLALGDDAARATLTEYAAAAKVLVTLQIPVSLVGAFVLLPIFDAGRSSAEQIAFTACCVTTLASLLGREALYGIGEGRISAQILACGCIATLIGVTLVAAIGTAGVAAYLWIYALAGAGELSASILVARRRAPQREWEYRRGGASRVMTSGRSVIVLLLAQVVATRGDRLVIGALAGPSDLGQYAVAVSVMELLSMASFALGNVAFQGIASGQLTNEAMARARRATILVTTGAAAVLWLLAPFIIDLAFGDAFESAVPALRVLVVAAIPYGSFQIDTQQLIAHGKSSSAALLAVGAAASMVLGDIGVVPHWGIQGASWVSVLTYSAFAIVTRRVVRARQAKADAGT